MAYVSVRNRVIFLVRTYTPTCMYIYAYDTCVLGEWGVLLFRYEYYTYMYLYIYVQYMCNQGVGHLSFLV